MRSNSPEVPPCLIASHLEVGPTQMEVVVEEVKGGPWVVAT
jgi:hypothetical protein